MSRTLKDLPIELRVGRTERRGKGWTRARRWRRQGRLAMELARPDGLSRAG